MPRALDNQPEVYHWMFEYTRAFDLLSSRRSYGMGPNPITLQEISTYISMFGSEDVEEFVNLICAMDVTYLQVQAKIKSSETTKKGKK